MKGPNHERFLREIEMRDHLREFNAKNRLYDAILNAALAEMTLCPRCQVYHDDPEHWCGSVALVLFASKDRPQFWRTYFWAERAWYLMTSIHDRRY